MAKKKKKKKFSPGDVRDRHNYFETFFTRYEKIIFSLLVLLGIVLRIVIYHQLNRHRTLFEPSTGTDMGSYWEWANRVAGGEISREAFYMSPLYPYTVGLLIKMFGSSVSNVIVFQSLLGILNAVMIYFIARRLFGVIPAIFVLAGMLFHSMFILYENVILITTLSMFLNIAVLLLLNVYQFSKKNRFLYLSALVFGLNVLARGNILLFLPCVFIWILWKEKKYFRKGLGKITIYILIVLTVISPASLHNYHAEKEFILVTSNLGVNFFIGNHYDAKGWFSYPSEKMDIPHDLSSRQKSDYFVKKNI